jgi:hypothetical protein
VEKSAAKGGALVGACVWMLNSRGLPDWDSYGVHVPGTTGGVDLATQNHLDNPASVAELTRFAANMRKPVVVKPVVKPVATKPPNTKDAEVWMYRSGTAHVRMHRCRCSLLDALVGEGALLRAVCGAILWRLVD